MENKGFDPCVLLLHVAANSLPLSCILGVGCWNPDTQRCSWHRLYIPIELLPMLSSGLCGVYTATIQVKIAAGTYHLKTPVSRASRLPHGEEGSGQLSIQLSSHRNITVRWWPLALQVRLHGPSWQQRVVTQWGQCHCVVQWPFEKCLKAHMHSKRFCCNLSSRQSNGKRSFPLTVSSTSFSFQSSYILPLDVVINYTLSH